MITTEDREKHHPNCSDDHILAVKLIGGLTNDALQLWLENPVEEHPIFKALMVLMTPAGRKVRSYRLAVRLTDEARTRKLISKDDRWNLLVDFV